MNSKWIKDLKKRKELDKPWESWNPGIGKAILTENQKAIKTDIFNCIRTFLIEEKEKQNTNYNTINSQQTKGS